MAEGIKTRRGESKGILVTYLYNEGDECTDLTGGWSAVKVTSSSAWSSYEKKTDRFYAQVGKGGSLNPRENTIFFVTNNKIDLTDYSKLEMEFENVAQGGTLSASSVQIDIRSTKPTSSTGWEDSVLMASRNTSGTITADISKLNSSYYVCAIFYASYSSAAHWIQGDFIKAWLT